VPSLDAGVTKLAEHTGGEAVDPDHVDRTLREEDLRPLEDFRRLALMGLEPRPVRFSVCLYTLTPDRHFVIDRHPEASHVAYACGFSGHGFKFAPVVGEALADLAMAGRTELPVGFLRRLR
jgi:glycine/D-amino acid oxidase-like deaminating enzyme